MATKPGVMVNNWNPWCNFNVLTAALLTSDDYDLKVRLMRKSLTSVDQFINYYKSDGGCEEGPTYWDHAPGKMLEFLELTQKASNGNINIFGNELIKRMGKYIATTYIGGGYYLNFADANAINKGLPDIVYRYGKAINDKQLSDFGAYLSQEISKMPEVGGTLDASLQKFLIWEEMKKVTSRNFSADHFWLDGIQIAGGRSKNGSTDGFYFGAKGGNNNESHNHNDIGSFILYFNGDPIIIDAGVGTYTSKTFSSKRYELWNMQSAYHNLPVINGFQQTAGSKYMASDVKFQNVKNTLNFSLNIAKAYPNEARCKNWIRTYKFNRKSGLTITDKVELDSIINPNNINFLVAGKIEEVSKGRLKLNGKNESLIFVYNPKLFNYSVEKIEIDDERLSKVWGESIYRLSLIQLQQTLDSSHTFSIGLNK